MRTLIFRNLAELRQNYWFWPSLLTAVAFFLGLLLPFLDEALGAEWMEAVPFLRPTGVDGARAILTTLAGATLGVAGVAFSITIVAVNFASSNYGPRLIGNFMGDRMNQIVLGILVSTFVYCITVLSTVHAQNQVLEAEMGAFVPQLSVLFSLVLTLVSVGSLIGYIHHVPESINIMNLVAQIGTKLRASILRTLDEEAERRRDSVTVDVSAWRTRPLDAGSTLRAAGPGYLQQIDVSGLEGLAGEMDGRIVIHRTPGDFLTRGEPILTAHPQVEEKMVERLRAHVTQGTNRTEMQDILFLSDQLVEVLTRALSPGVNDPNTAILCLDWLRAGLSAFALGEGQAPPEPEGRVLYARVTFAAMLTRSFGNMRQHVAADRSVTLHAIAVLTDLAVVATNETMVRAIRGELDRLGAAAADRLPDRVGRAEAEAALIEAHRRIAGRADEEIGASTVREPE
ncbi:DUF2254 domain-containing protein [Acuticoccus sp. I52.16.1]|uniref:DUF2254 domain-containing protein n=1 Tax=Acuticoccus sp. I52.16.1 TaxID=2928472 RepID=UPI001FD477C1|nr:DUF2254 domain-containing protein [Acuticoccus sp. I52.16.1]UOM32869.1 DUF2254 domain-containing protein [Acuticoccus sp. I52.16.1]